MKLLTAEIMRKLPTLESVRDDGDPKVVLKIFTPDSGWTWYAYAGVALLQRGDNFEEMPLKEVANRYGVMMPGEARYDEGQSVLMIDILFSGYVKGLENECGDFALSELVSVRGAFGLPVERDKWWSDAKLSEVMSGKTN